MFSKVTGAFRLITYFFNPFKNFYLTLTGKLPRIEWMVYEVTDACNSRCRHCNIWKEKPTRDVLSMTDIRRIFSDPLLFDLKAILVTGGEPVLRSDLAEMFLTIHKLLPQARLTLSTNGLLPERVIEVVKKMIAQDIGLDIGISLDAVGDKNDELRGVKGNYERVDHLLKELARIKAENRADFNIVIGHTLSPLTIDTVDEVKQYAKKHGAVFLTQLYDEASYYHNIDNLASSQQDKNRMASVIDKLAPSFHKELLWEILRHKIVRFKCFAMKTFFVLRCNGDVVPCLQKSHIKAGNLKQQTLSEIWNGPRAQEIRGNVSACQGCANSWATNWSMKANYFSFIPLILRALTNKILNK